MGASQGKDEEQRDINDDIEANDYFEEEQFENNDVKVKQTAQLRNKMKIGLNVYQRLEQVLPLQILDI